MPRPTQEERDAKLKAKQAAEKERLEAKQKRERVAARAITACDAAKAAIRAKDYDAANSLGEETARLALQLDGEPAKDATP